MDLGKEYNSSALVPTDCGAIAEHDPPTLPALLLRHRGQQVAGLLIAEREQRQLLPTVQPSDDPRRVTAEFSAPGVEQDGTWELRRGRPVRAHVPDTPPGSSASACRTIDSACESIPVSSASIISPFEASSPQVWIAAGPKPQSLW